MHKILLILAFLQLSLVAYDQQRDTIAIENVNVIPMTGEVVLTNKRVLIADGRIVKIESASIVDARHKYLVIHATGKYLIPGLSEMHYHFRSNDIASDLKLFLANGITTV